jgi:hypothetical protein
MTATGDREEDAAKHVARVLNKAGLRDIDATNVLSWRDKFMRKHSGPGSDWYRKFMEMEVEDGRERASVVLSWAVAMGKLWMPRVKYQREARRKPRRPA